MLSKAYRLRALQVRVTAHKARNVFFGNCTQNVRQVHNALLQIGGCAAQIQALVKGDLVVAAAPRVNLFARVAEPFG